jgi:glyoxylase-like metal-dependent hydrolase (beta-lactamase superfamily II)
MNKILKSTMPLLASFALAISTLSASASEQTLEQAPEQEGTSDLSFSVIVTAQSGGTQEAMVVSSGSWFTHRKLVHNAILIKHPKGDILWDSGIGTDIESQMEVFAFWEKQLFAIENIRPAVQQLTSNNYPVEKIKAIIPSHMHWDHVSGIEDFSSTPVWIQKQEHEAAHQGEPPGFVLSQFDSPDINWQFIELNDTPYKGFDRSLDIYGDGSLVLVDLAGHSQGHLGLFVYTQHKGDYFFIGDATWAIKGIQDNRGRPRIVQWAVGVDDNVAKAEQVIDKIHSLSKKEPNLVVVPAHDEIVTSRLPNYPEFL